MAGKTPKDLRIEEQFYSVRALIDQIMTKLKNSLMNLTYNTIQNVLF